MRNKIFILTILFGFLFVGTSYAALLVPEQYPTIQAAINYATDHHMSGASISVKAGTYNGYIYLYDYTYYVGGGIHIYSRTGPEDTIINGQGNWYVVRITNGEENDTIIEGFTITGGGIGVFIENASPVIKNCIITGNSKKGISASASEQWMNCHPKIIRNKIIENGGDSYSGGVDIFNNATDPEHMIFQNNIIADNYGSSFGGLHMGGKIIATNNTIVRNYSAYESNNAGGVQFAGTSGFTFTNNIVWDNYTVHYYNPSQIVTYDNIDYPDNPPTINYNCIMGGWDGPGVGNVINRNPLIMPNYGLRPFSPCIDAGYFDPYVTGWYDFYGNTMYDDQQVENTGVGDGGYPTNIFKDIGAIENMGGSWVLEVPSGGGAIADIQDAVDVAWDGAIIVVGPGTYGPVDTGGKKLTIKSTGGAGSTIIDGGGSVDVVKFHHEEKVDYIDTILDGFTIRNGQKGVDFSGYDKKVIKNNIIDTVSTGNAAIHGEDSISEISGNVLTGNYRGICLIDSSSIIEDNNITDNRVTSGDGAGIFISNAAPEENLFEQPIEITSNTIKNNTISGNETAARGGGLYLSNCTADIVNNLIADNSSTDGAGIFCGIGTDLQITNNTIATNTATSGGGVYIESYQYMPHIANTIIWDNQATLKPSIYVEISWHPDVSYSDIETGGDPWEDINHNPNTNINSNPLFVNPTTEDYSLDSNSQCIDRANSDMSPAKDMLNNDRYDDETVVDGGNGPITYVDIGSIERQTDSTPGGNTEVPGDYATIQDAIDDVIGGTVILVHHGTYNENINFNGKAVRVKSVSGAYITEIHGVSSTAAVVIFGSGENQGSVLEGFTITGGRDSGVKCTNFSSPTIKNCIIKENQAFKGGGIICDQSAPRIINSIIASNHATGYYGGGISCDRSSPYITNCTITGNTINTIPSKGGGIYCNWDSYPTVTNTIIWGNPANFDPGIGLNTSSVPVVTYSDVEGVNVYSGTGNINADPLLLSSYKLGRYSPCIDRADDAVAPDLDLEDHTRYDDPDMPNYEGSIVDIGALERQTRSRITDPDPLPRRPRHSIEMP